MNDLSYGVALASLGDILNKLQQNSDIAESPELSETVTNALGFHQILSDGLSKILDEIVLLRHENAHLSGTLEDVPPSYEDIVPLYKTIQDAGGDAQLVCKVALVNEVSSVTIIRILRDLYGFTLEDAHHLLYQHPKTNS